MVLKKKVTNIVNPVMVTNSTSQDIGPQGINEEKHIVALINWEKILNCYFISGPSI